MKTNSIYYYIIVWLVLFIIFISTIIKVFVDAHPLKYIFIILFVIGLIVGYFRYMMRIKKDQAKSAGTYNKLMIVLVFIFIYVGIKESIKQFVGSEVSSQDYGIVIAFFFLGLFITYYGLYPIYIWKSHSTKNDDQGIENE